MQPPPNTNTLTHVQAPPPTHSQTHSPVICIRLQEGNTHKHTVPDGLAQTQPGREQQCQHSPVVQQEVKSYLHEVQGWGKGAEGNNVHLYINA
eukprot:1149544-Pelagomonas_calceolata.AAC.1